jgi:hypothetical protein
MFTHYPQKTNPTIEMTKYDPVFDANGGIRMTDSSSDRGDDATATVYLNPLHGTNYSAIDHVRQTCGEHTPNLISARGLIMYPSARGTSGYTQYRRDIRLPVKSSCFAYGLQDEAWDYHHGFVLSYTAQVPKTAALRGLTMSDAELYLPGAPILEHALSNAYNVHPQVRTGKIELDDLNDAGPWGLDDIFSNQDESTTIRGVLIEGSGTAQEKRVVVDVIRTLEFHPLGSETAWKEYKENVSYQSAPDNEGLIVKSASKYDDDFSKAVTNVVVGRSGPNTLRQATCDIFGNDRLPISIPDVNEHAGLSTCSDIPTRPHLRHGLRSYLQPNWMYPPRNTEQQVMGQYGLEITYTAELSDHEASTINPALPISLELHGLSADIIDQFDAHTLAEPSLTKQNFAIYNSQGSRTWPFASYAGTIQQGDVSIPAIVDISLTFQQVAEDMKNVWEQPQLHGGPRREFVSGITERGVDF